MTHRDAPWDAPWDVIVIGGGLHGASAALHLSLRRQRVLVLERRQVGRHASGASAGGVRTLGRDLAEVPLACAGMELWHGIGRLVDDDCGFHAHGQIKIAETKAELAALEARAAEMRVRGFHHEELIDGAELARLLPALGPACAGALIVRDDGAADPFRTTMAFRHKAEASGAVFREAEAVTGLERTGDLWRVDTSAGQHQAPVVVNCAGAWAGLIAAMAGDAIPLVTRCSMMIVTERLRHFIDPVVGAAGRKLSFKQTNEGSVLIGGGHQARPDLDNESYELDAANLAKGAAAAIALFPVMKGARIVRSWAGLEAQTPDSIPVIGFSPGAPGLIHSFGYSGHGFQLGPIVGSAVADLVTQGATNLPIAPFAASRFSAHGQPAT
jgi:sarcosine oxidase subunit beta